MGETLQKGFDIMEPTVENVQPDPITIKTRYFIECVKRDLDRNELNANILDAFEKTIDVEALMSRLKPWKLIYGVMNGSGCCCYKHFMKDVRFE